MKVCMLVFFAILAGCTHYKPTKVVTHAEVVERTPVGTPYTEQTTESKTRVSAKTEDEVDVHGNLVSEGTGRKNTTTVTRTRCLQEFNVVTSQTYDVEHKLAGRGFDFAGGALLIIAGVGATLAGLPGRDFSGYRRPAAYHMFLLGGLAIGGGGALIANGVIKGKRPAPDPQKGLAETLQNRQIVEVDTCPGFGNEFVADAQAEPEPAADIPERIKRLDELHSSGVLTEEEYKSRRAELINQL